MSETDLFGALQAVSGLYATLLGMVITINFAMIVAIWTFLHRTALGFRLVAFGFYLVGMGLLCVMLLQQARIREKALDALRALPEGERSPFITAFLATQDGATFEMVWLFQHLSPLLLVLAVAYLLFVWRGRDKA